MTKEQFIKELEHIAESGSNEIRLGNLFDLVISQDHESRWISVKTPPELTEQVFWYNDDNERVPWEGKFQRHVLAVDADGRIFMARLDCNGWAEVSKNSISGLVNPTHWQPLPEPPKTVTP